MASQGIYTVDFFAVRTNLSECRGRRLLWATTRDNSNSTTLTPIRISIKHKNSPFFPNLWAMIAKRTCKKNRAGVVFLSPDNPDPDTPKVLDGGTERSDGQSVRTFSVLAHQKHPHHARSRLSDLCPDRQENVPGYACQGKKGGTKVTLKTTGLHILIATGPLLKPTRKFRRWPATTALQHGQSGGLVAVARRGRPIISGGGVGYGEKRRARGMD